MRDARGVETPRAHGAFLRWCEGGFPTFLDLAAGLGTEQSAISRWAARWDWRRRAGRYVRDRPHELSVGVELNVAAADAAVARKARIAADKSTEEDYEDPAKREVVLAGVHRRNQLRQGRATENVAVDLMGVLRSMVTVLHERFPDHPEAVDAVCAEIDKRHPELADIE